MEQEHIVEWAVAIINSGFGTALAGAFFGAVAASYFASRSSRKQLQQSQLFALNASSLMAQAVFSHALGFKEQLALPLVEKFNQAAEKYKKEIAQAKNGEHPSKVITVDYDFYSLRLFRHNAHELEQLVLQKTGASKKLHLATIFLVQTLDSLAAAVEQREKEIRRLIKLKDELSQDQLAEVYFGFPSSDGNHDTRMSDTIESISVQLDDTIFYSKFIAENASAEAKVLSKSIGKHSPKPTEFHLESSKNKQLLPDPRNYSDWM